MYLGRIHTVGGEIELDWCGCDVIWWSCDRLGTHGGAGGDFGSVIFRVFKSRRWFGQTVI